MFGWKVGTNPDGFDPLLGCLDGGWRRDGLNPKGIFADYAGWTRPPDFDGRSRSHRVGLVHVPCVHPPTPPFISDAQMLVAQMFGVANKITMCDSYINY